MDSRCDLLAAAARAARVAVAAMVFAVGASAAGLAGTSARADAAAVADRAPVSPTTPEQVGAWRAVSLSGATCGRGAPYRYFYSPETSPGGGIVFVLNGGGACLKDGPPPPGAEGIARQLHCMAFSNFTDALANELAVQLLSTRVEILQRNDDSNPFRDYTHVFVPYCTGDVHTGAMTDAYDYDPDPTGEFPVVHRGHLNLVAVLDDVAARYPGDRPVVVTGVSAGGFGAIFNYPEFVRRWPQAVLIPDSGIGPPHPDSLMAREGARVAARWGARAILPSYCSTDDCIADTLRLLAAHARHFDGRIGPWRPFGFVQGQRDATLSAYLELDPCSYEAALRRGMADLPANVRAFAPSTSDHVFLATPGYATPQGNVELTAWFRAVATASTTAALPPGAVDAWRGCHELTLPWLGRGG